MKKIMCQRQNKAATKKVKQQQKTIKRSQANIYSSLVTKIVD